MSGHFVLSSSTCYHVHCVCMHTCIRVCILSGCFNLLFRNFKFQDVHVEGARLVAEACRAAGVKRLIHVSALNADTQSPSKFLQSKVEPSFCTTTYMYMYTVLPCCYALLAVTPPWAVRASQFVVLQFLHVYTCCKCRRLCIKRVENSLRTGLGLFH